MQEYKKVLNDKQWNEVGKYLTINKWQAGLILSGALLAMLGVAFYFGTAIGAMLNWITS